MDDENNKIVPEDIDTNSSTTKREEVDLGNALLREQRNDKRAIAYPLVVLAGLSAGWWSTEQFSSVQNPHYGDYKLLGALVGGIVFVLVAKLYYLYVDSQLKS